MLGAEVYAKTSPGISQTMLKVAQGGCHNSLAQITSKYIPGDDFRLSVFAIWMGFVCFCIELSIHKVCILVDG